MQVHSIYRQVLHDEIGAPEGTAEIKALIKSPETYSVPALIVIGGMCSATVSVMAFSGSFVDMLMVFWLGGLLAFIRKSSEEAMCLQRQSTRLLLAIWFSSMFSRSVRLSSSASLLSVAEQHRVELTEAASSFSDRPLLLCLLGILGGCLDSAGFHHL
jgi:uncharacterized membrane protein YjjP (DUF1212 family)